MRRRKRKQTSKRVKQLLIHFNLIYSQVMPSSSPDFSKSNSKETSAESAILCPTSIATFSHLNCRFVTDRNSVSTSTIWCTSVHSGHQALLLQTNDSFLPEWFHIMWFTKLNFIIWILQLPFRSTVRKMFDHRKCSPEHDVLFKICSCRLVISSIITLVNYPLSRFSVCHQLCRWLLRWIICEIKGLASISCLFCRNYNFNRTLGQVSVWPVSRSKPNLERNLVDWNRWFSVISCCNGELNLILKQFLHDLVSLIDDNLVAFRTIRLIYLVVYAWVF